MVFNKIGIPHVAMTFIWDNITEVSSHRRHFSLPFPYFVNIYFQQFITCSNEIFNKSLPAATLVSALDEDAVLLLLPELYLALFGAVSPRLQALPEVPTPAPKVIATGAASSNT